MEERRTRLAVAVVLQGLGWAWHALGPGGVDPARYHEAAARAAAACRVDPLATGEALVRSLLHLPGGWEHGLAGGASTGTIVAVAAALHLALGGSPAAVTAGFALGGLAGKWALYRAFVELEPRWERAAFLAVFAVPSTLIWTSGLLKESLAALALGVAVHGAARARAHGWIGAAGLLLVRPHAALALAPAVVALVPGSDRARVARVAVAVAGLTLAAELLARPLGGWPISAHLAWHQQAALADAARSAAPVVTVVPTSLAGQVALAPWALFTGLFRPGLWEAHAATAVAAGVENAALLGVFVVAVARRERADWSRAGVLFALTFAALFALGVGLTTSNLGTLSRYRALLAPFAWWAALSGALRER